MRTLTPRTGMATVPPRTLGEANRGLLVVLPGILLPKSVQPHPTRQHRRVFRILSEAVGPSFQERDVTRSSRFSQVPSSTCTEAPGPTRSACVQRTASALLQNPIFAVPSSCALCAAPLDYGLAQEFLIFATARDVSRERCPNVIGRVLSCSNTREPRGGGWRGVFQRAARGREYPRPALPPKVWRADPIRRHRLPKESP